MDSGPSSIDVVLCDLDGVVWLAGMPVAGSVEAITDLRRRRCRVIFVTNNSRRRRRDIAADLAAIGLDTAESDIVSSAMAAAGMIVAGERVLVVGGPGVVEAVTDAGGVVTIAGAPIPAVGSDHAVVEAVGDGVIDAVVVGLATDFGYETVRVAADAIRAGARFVATNTDPTYPTPDGPVPGAGSLVAAVRVAAGVDPVIAGKPYAPMVEVIESSLGTTLERSRMLVVGDRRSTDGALATRIGCRFALVSSGVEEIHDGEGTDPTFVVDDLASLVIHYGELFGR